ncbi:PaaI family thioesterase [Paenibacillus sp. N1-5-1-14]|uniref:PaaI family thioesterase n=1 Tax=Paenibacillus radicibacter TaxID=2972488 RepID=UPI0021591867|nr:PaaI family thioesterase [Paenibacillus radicibacter]MCR8642364.1 PaaI family thioesterase [Paenibacillus radicibacter]
MHPFEQELEANMKHIYEIAERTFWGFLGCKVESIESGIVKISLEAQPHHLNIIGIVHGGVLSSLLDNAMGLAVILARPDEKSVTANLNMHFVAPMSAGKLLVTAEIVHQSRRSITTSGTVTDEQGKLGAMGTGSFRII